MCDSSTDWSVFDTLIESSKNSINNLNSRNCRECGADESFFNEDHMTSDIICTSCGLVLDQLADSSPEWFASIGNESSSGGNNVRGTSWVGNENILFSSETQLSTSIQLRSRSKNHKNIIRFHNFSKMTAKDYNLWVNYCEIERVATQLSLSELIILTSKVIYKETHLIKIKRGNPKKGYIGGCIFVSCKIHNCNCISQTKLADILHIPRKFITQNIKYIEKYIWNFESYKFNIIDHQDHYHDYIFFIVGIIENPTPQNLPKQILEDFNANESFMKVQPFANAQNGSLYEIQKLTKFISSSVGKLSSKSIDIQPDILTATLIYIYVLDILKNTQTNYKLYLKKLLANAIRTSIACFHNKISLCRDQLELNFND